MPEKFFRNTDPLWLKNFLRNGIVNPREGYEFISLSTIPDSGSKKRAFGRMRIVFDADKVERQGGYPIDYDFLDIDEVGHLCGISQKEKERMTDWQWEVEMQDIDVEQYRKEQEVIIPQIEYEQGLIAMVCADENDLQIVQNELDYFNIPHSTDFSKCS